MIAWTAHPAARRPQDVMLVVFVIAIACYAILVSMQSAWLAAIAAIMIVVAIAPFLLRSHYRIDDDGVTMRRGFVTRTRRWSELRRIEIGRAAALVSPYAQRRWLDRYRGLAIYFDGADREQVAAELTERRARLGA